jgi:hypothetical protein
MTFNFKRIGVTAGAAAFSLSMVACHGQSPGGSSYVPTGSTAVSAPQPGMSLVTPDKKREKIEIVSSCGKHVRIVLLGILDCKFKEEGYGDGKFTLQNDTKGIILITPMSGTRATTFTIVGAVVGSGSFVVTDAKKKHSLRVRVKVTL